MPYLRGFKWGVISFISYSVLSLLGAIVNYLGKKMVADGDSVEIVANILTTTQGFFTGVLGLAGIIKNIDFFEYSGFHLSSFILGGLVWFLFAILLYYKSEDKGNPSEKRSYIASLFIKSGITSFIISIVLTGIYYLFTNDPFFPLVLIYLSVIYVPLFLIGLILKIIRKT